MPRAKTKRVYQCTSCEQWVWRVFDPKKSQKDFSQLLENHLSGPGKQHIDSMRFCQSCNVGIWTCLSSFDRLSKWDCLTPGLPQEVPRTVTSTTGDINAQLTPSKLPTGPVGPVLPSPKIRTPRKGTPVKQAQKRRPSTPVGKRPTPVKIIPPKKRAEASAVKQLFRDDSVVEPTTSSTFHEYAKAPMSEPPKDVVGNAGRYFRDKYLQGEKRITELDVANIGEISGKKSKDVVGAMKETRVVYNQMKCQLLDDMEFQLTKLCSSHPAKKSVLRHTTVEELSKGDFLLRCLQEMDERSDILLDVLVTAMCGVKKPEMEKLRGPLAVCYGIIMHIRDQNHTGCQRLLSIILSSAGIPERTIRTLDRLGLHLSYTAKLRTMDQCVDAAHASLMKELNSGRLVTLVGDNMDFTVKPHIMTSEKKSVMHHFYNTMVTFSRLDSEIKASDKTSTPQKNPLPETFVLSAKERKVLLYSYKVLLSRTMVKYLPAFKFIGDSGLYPQHIPFKYSAQMSKKSTVRSLPVIFENEKFLESCVVILDETTKNMGGYLSKVEELTGLPNVPYYGDQLTRDNLDHGKGLRTMAPTPEARFDAIGPFVCTYWHQKQDFLEKLYLMLWDKKTGASREKLTLPYFKVHFKANNVTGDVKKNYQAHEHLALRVGELMQMEQVLSFLGMSDHESWPEKLPRDIADKAPEEQLKVADDIIDAILAHYEYGQFSFTETNETRLNPPPETIKTKTTKVRRCGIKIKTKIAVPPDEDELFAYCNNVARLVMHLQYMNDFEKEGDFERAVISCKSNVPVFYRRSASRSKYFVESIDTVLKSEVIGSEADRLRVKEGGFVNPRGGKGKGYAIDLMCEHGVRRKKRLVRALGSNKNERAMSRSAGAADAVDDVTNKLDAELKTPQKRGRHTDAESQTDIKNGKKFCRDQKPMIYKEGRKFKYHHPVPAALYAKFDIDKLRTDIFRVSGRLMKGQHVEVEEEDAQSSASTIVDEGIPEMDTYD